MNNITYTEYYKDSDSKFKENEACFSSLYFRGSKHPYKVVYKANARQLSKKEVVFYYRFLQNMLDSKLFTMEFDKQDHPDDKIDFKWTGFVIWTLNTTRLSQTKALLYLTAFRYLDEFYEFVKELYARRQRKSAQNWDTLFSEFQAMHICCHSNEATCKKFNQKYVRTGGSPSGHGLMYQYNWYGLKEFPQLMPLSSFKEQLKKKHPTVHHFFRPANVSNITPDDGDEEIEAVEN